MNIVGQLETALKIALGNAAIQEVVVIIVLFPLACKFVCSQKLIRQLLPFCKALSKQFRPLIFHQIDFLRKNQSNHLDKNLDKELEQFVAKRINADDSNGNNLSHENELLKNLAGLRGITASDVMVPRIDIVSVAMSDDFDEIVKQLIKTNHSRVPVRNESLDDIVGILHIKDVLANLFLKEKQDIKNLIKKPIFVSPSISLLDLLYEMRVKRRHLALVVDEYGGIDGLVTIEDLVEELVGDIEDEHDLSTECRLEKMQDGSIVLEARITMDLIEDLLSSIRKEDLNEEIETLGGFIINIAGRVPVKGEVIKYSPSGLKFEILEADPRKVILVKLRGLNKLLRYDESK